MLHFSDECIDEKQPELLKLFFRIKLTELQSTIAVRRKFLGG